MMLGPSRGAGYSRAVARLKRWTRRRFRLEEDAVVFVAELSCGVPGCPPIETVVAFWSAPEIRHQFKFFKGVREIAEDELPPWWMKSAIIVDPDDISCC